MGEVGDEDKDVGLVSVGGMSCFFAGFRAPRRGGRETIWLVVHVENISKKIVCLTETRDVSCSLEGKAFLRW